MNNALDLINEIAIEQIDSVYYGKPGCMCGCKGDYSEAGLKAKRRLTNMIRFAEQEGIEVEQGSSLEGRRYLYLEKGQKVYAIYYFPKKGRRK